MQNALAFKKRYLLLILLALVAFGVYKVLHFSPLEQEIIKKVKVNNLANLYITEASAGATTGFSYRSISMMQPKMIKRLWRAWRTITSLS